MRDDILNDGSIFGGDFQTTRTLANLSLYGGYEADGVTITPRGTLSYMKERQNDYTVTDGENSVQVDGVSLEIDRLTLSADVVFPLNGENTNFFIRPSSAWNFHLSGVHPSAEQVSSSIEFGVISTSSAGWSSKISVGYNGIGNDNGAVSAQFMLQTEF